MVFYYRQDGGKEERKIEAKMFIKYSIKVYRFLVFLYTLLYYSRGCLVDFSFGFVMVHALIFMCVCFTKWYVLYYIKGGDWGVKWGGF